MENKVYYVRVSTNTKGQEQSYEAQQQYFKSMGITKGYSDKGITGTTINREGFKAMLYDAGIDIIKIENKYVTSISDREPKFNMIYTKSISRFSRDITMAMQIVRELRQKGVGVYFLDINQSSLDPTTDTILSIMFSISTEESRAMSRNIKIGNQQSALQGNIRAINLYGYTYNKENKSLQIVPEEAEVVKLIYQLRLEGKGSRQICNYLNNNGYRTRSNTKWLPNVTNRLLQNKTYCGYSVRNKFDCDTIMGENSHKVKNKSEWIEVKTDKIPPIISEEDFEKVQDLITQSLSKDSRGKYVGKGELAGKIICGKCGHTYYRCQDKKKNKNGEYLLVTYRCSNKKRNGKSACDSKNVPEEEIYRNINERCVNFKKETEELLIIIKEEAEKIYNGLDNNFHKKEILEIKDNIECVNGKLSILLDMVLNKEVNKEVYNSKRIKLEDKLEEYKNILKEYENEILIKENNKTNIESIIDEAENILKNIPQQLDAQYFIENYLDKIYIYSKNDIEIEVVDVVSSLYNKIINIIIDK